MSSSSTDKKTLVIFGSTGKQGGSLITTVLSSPTLSSTYSLIGITRSTTSSKSQALAAHGVTMSQADLDDLSSLESAIPRDTHGVFGVTDFWSHLDKNREIQQGKNIFTACQTKGVKHLIWSSLPSAARISGGKFKGVEHFDSKAEVEEYITSSKPEMTVSYLLPAMFVDFAKTMVHNATLALPFPSDKIDWPLLDPEVDTGKFALGLFEAGTAAHLKRVNAVSTWTTPSQVVATLSKASGQQVTFSPIPGDVFEGFLPKNIAPELREMFEYIGEFNYYGKDEKEKQGESDKWLVEGSEKKVSYEQWVGKNGPWKW